MQLSRNTVCTLFEIRAPRWQGTNRQKIVGLKLSRIGKHNEIHFTYRRKSDGELSFPDPYYFDGDNMKGLDYELQNIKGTTLVLIPFNDLERLERV